MSILLKLSTYETLFLSLKVAALVFQDEKSQLLITYIWLDYVSTAIIHANFSASDVWG